MDRRNAYEEGEKQSNNILEKQVFSKELPLKLNITNNKRINLATASNNVTKTCSNAVGMERNVLAMRIYSAERNYIIAPALVLVKRITKECLIIFNADGSRGKLQRASCFSLFKDKLCLKFLEHTSALLIWGLYGDLHPHLDDPDAKTNSGPDY